MKIGDIRHNAQGWRNFVSAMVKV